MSGLVQRVRANVDVQCVVAEMDKEGCRVSLDGAPAPRLIVDLDERGSPLGHPNRRCDYLFFGDDNDGGADWVAPLELKRGRFRAGQCLRQLKAGAQAADELVPENAKVRFRPIAVYGGVLHSAQLLRLRRYGGIIFRDIHEPVRLLKCCEALTDQLR